MDFVGDALNIAANFCVDVYILSVYISINAVSICFHIPSLVKMRYTDIEFKKGKKSRFHLLCWHHLVRGVNYLMLTCLGSFGHDISEKYSTHFPNISFGECMQHNVSFGKRVYGISHFLLLWYLRTYSFATSIGVLNLSVMGAIYQCSPFT